MCEAGALSHNYSSLQSLDCLVLQRAVALLHLVSGACKLEVSLGSAVAERRHSRQSAQSSDLAACAPPTRPACAHNEHTSY